jgi:arginine utilization protein RocB
MGFFAGLGPIMSMASMGFNFASQMGRAAGEKAASDAHAAKLARAADYGRTSANQTSAALTEDLTTTLGMIDAIKAAGGTDATSPTTAAYRERQGFIGTRKKNIQVTNILAQANQDDADAAYLRQSGSYAMGMGQLGAFGGLVKGFSSMDWGGFG